MLASSRETGSPFQYNAPLASIALHEGYVDVATLPLWIGNHRVELYVDEFRTFNGRDPNAEELLSIMHGKLALPSQDSVDPFKLRGLAASIARKGVERAPIVTWEGEPKDGNRRIAASRLVLADPDATFEAKERARWIRVWQAPEGTTDDQFEAIVVALNHPAIPAAALPCGRVRVRRTHGG